MKSKIGTCANITNLIASWHGGLRSFLRKAFLVLSFVLVALGAKAATEQEKPLFLSYEKRAILTYLLAGAGESEETQMKMAQRLEKWLVRYIQTPTKDVPVRNFGEFIKVYKGPWPDSYSVASDIQLIEGEGFRGGVNYVAVTERGLENPALQSQIEGFIDSQNRRLFEKTGISQAPIAKLTELVEPLLQSKNSSEKRSFILSGFAKATELVNRQLSVLENVGHQMATSGKLANLDPAMRLFLETVLQEYFSRLEISSKKHIVSRFLGQSLTSSSMEKFELMLMSAGPQFQKLLQIIAGNSRISSDLAVILKKLESKVVPIPAPIVRQLFEAERERYGWISYEEKPLGTGTMAQVHKGMIKSPQGPLAVVIRFLKPNIEKRVAEDERILNEIARIMDADNRFRQAGFPKLGPVISDLNKTVTDELDLQATIRRQKIGREAYNRSTLLKMEGYKNYLEIRVPFVVDGGAGSNLMVQELVEGRKLDSEIVDYRTLMPKLGKVLSEQLAMMWVQEAFFASGFFHSDLHQGNYLIRVTDPAIILAPLDFGMGGVLSKELQSNMLLLGIADKLDRPDLVAKAIWAMSLIHTNKTSEADFQKRVQLRMENIRRGLIEKASLNEWMGWAMDQGIRFPYDIVSLNRGMVILDQALKEAGSQWTISSLTEKLAPKYGRKQIHELYKKSILTNKDFLKLGMAALQDSEELGTPRGRPAVQCSRIYQGGSFLNNVLRKASGN